jgi:putative endopeptidase
MKKLLTVSLTLLAGAAATFLPASDALAQSKGKGKVQGLDMSNFDKNVKPQDDFFKYVNGGWYQRTNIPGNESRWGSFNEIDENNRKILREIVEKAAAESGKAPKGSAMQLIGDLFASGMDSARIEQLGKQPIEPFFAQIDGIKTKEDLVMTIADLQLKGFGSLLGLGISPDAKNSRMNAVQMGGGGTSLPGRSYYLETSPRMVKIREDYMMHLAKMFELAGVEATAAKKNADIVFAMEKRMAEAQRTPVENRDPQKRYNKKSIADIKQMTFNINWDKYMDKLGFAGVDSIIVGQPEFVAMTDRMIGDYTTDEWKVYLKWRVLNGSAGMLSSAFVNENFRFFSTTLNGVKEMQPRWRRMIGTVNGSLGDALGELYVAKAFTPEAKKRMAEMIENIRAAFADRIRSREWMSETTKQQALKKLAAIVYKIGYPDKWENYAGLEIKRDDFFGNMMRVRALGRQKMMARLGKPVDRSEWFMTPPTVNAYYSPVSNEIAFPAGILQPPFFDVRLDDAVNYGAIGAVIGHELSHGFDDQGSQYDADGNLKNWWTPEDRKNFDQRAQMLVQQFNEYTVLDTVHVNGKLTLGENIGDLGGITIAYAALEKSWEKNGKPKPIDNFTAEQRFFIGWAMGWRAKYRDEATLNQIKTDPHSPPYYRVVGPLSNFEPFYKAYGVKEGDKMYRPADKRVMIW